MRDVSCAKTPHRPNKDGILKYEGVIWEIRGVLPIVVGTSAISNILF